MSRFKKITEIYDMKVFTDEGYFFGEIEEAIIEENKIKSWRIRSVPGSILTKSISSAKGVIIPNKFFKAFGDIVIVQTIDLNNQSNTRENNKYEKDDK